MNHPAVDSVRRAAEELHTVLFPAEGRRSQRQDLDEFAAQALDQAIQRLGEAEHFLRTGPQGSGAAVAEAMRRVREASDAIESTRGLVRWMPPDVVHARADALRLLDRLTGRL